VDANVEPGGVAGFDGASALHARRRSGFVLVRVRAEDCGRHLDVAVVALRSRRLV
jgi:hypothetical protein